MISNWNRRFAWDRPLWKGCPVTVEQALFLALIALAVVTRFWDLGSRALHHDESLHATWSWYLYEGRGYRHDPMMHGPFQFFWNAFIFFVAGDSDYTSRVLPAIFGVAAVALPYALRRYLGRIGAFVLAVFLLISPSFMYYSRFARNDIYVAVWHLILVIAMFSYVRTRRPAWFYVFMAALSLSFATKETAYITTAIFVSFIVLAAAAGLTRWALGLTLAYAVMVFAAFFLSLGMIISAIKLAQNGIIPIRGVVVPLFVFLVLTALYVAVMLYLISRQNPRDGRPLSAWLLSMFTSAPEGSVTYAVGALARQRSVIYTGIAVFFAIFVVLFTSFFTNLAGFGTGAVGAIAYWLEQHEVERGGQPWFYYLLMIPLYEPLALILAIWGAVTALIKRNVFASFLVFWMFTSLAIYSWAGEKMPWLVLHMVLPIAMLGAWQIHHLFSDVDWRDFWRGGAAWVAIWGVLGLAALGALLTFGLPNGSRITETSQQVHLMQWIVLAVFVVGLLGEAWRRANRLGGAFTLRVVVLVMAAVLGLYEVRSAIGASFLHGDVPVDMLIYTQTSPYVPQVMRRIDALSARLTGEKDLAIAYDSGVSWPFEWYLRDYKYRQFFGSSGNPPEDAPVVLVSVESIDQVRSLMGNYVAEAYPMRWWFPEDYRTLTPEYLAQTVLDPKLREWLWRFVMYRDLGKPIDSYDFTLFIRKDLVMAGGESTTVAPAAPAVSAADPYAALVKQPSIGWVIGGSGTAPGLFNQPKGLAVDDQGNVYVADSLNNRVQKFDATGRFVTQWGGLGDAQGQFKEPWGMAVDQQGSVYVADTWNHRIQKFTSDGQFVTMWGGYGETGGKPDAAPGLFYGPRAIAIDATGKLYITDAGNKRVQVFDANGTFIAQWGTAGAGQGQLDEPVGIAFEPTGMLLVADTWNQRIQRFDPNGRPLASWPVAGWQSKSVLNKPYLAVLPNGNVVTTDPERNRVILFNQQGQALSVWNSAGERSPLHDPIGVATDKSGNTYVSDALNNRIAKFGPAE